jgi:hypothetical protein
MNKPVAIFLIYLAVIAGIILGGPFEWFQTGNKREDLLILLGLAGLPFLVWRTLSQSRLADAALKNSETALKQATDTETKNLSEQFAKAVEQLGSKHVYIRVGAIVVIEQVFQARPDHYRKIIIEILVAFVRNALRIPMDGPDYKEWAEWQSKRNIKEVPARRADVAIALKVLGRCRRVEVDDEIELNFELADLEGANLSKGNFRRANFFRARLIKSNLGSADFTGANLQQCIAREAKLRGANFKGAEFSGADFKNTDLLSALSVPASMYLSAGIPFPISPSEDLEKKLREWP